MIPSEKQSTRLYEQPVTSAASDWLRLGVMLLLLAVGRSVAPMHHPPDHLNSTTPNVPTTHMASFISARANR